jgi:hypothetical protein
MIYDTGATHSAGNNLKETLHHSPNAHGTIRTQAGMTTLLFYQVKLELLGLEQPGRLSGSQAIGACRLGLDMFRKGRRMWLE